MAAAPQEKTLTARQTVILKRIAQGIPQKAIADELGISLKTVEYHLKTARPIIGARCLADVIRWAFRTGLVSVFAFCIFNFELLAQTPPQLAAPSTNATADAFVAWDRSPSTNVTGYRVYYGLASRTYSSTVTVGNVTNATLPGLAVTNKWFIAATAYDAAGSESDFSNEVTWPPAAKTNRLVTIQPLAAGSPSGPWLAITNWPPLVLTNPAGSARWYRVSITSSNW